MKGNIMDDKALLEFIQLAFRTILQNSPDLLFFKDAELRYIAASDSFAKMVGYENARDLFGKTDFDIFNTELARRYTEDDRKVLESGISIEEHIEPLPDINDQKSYSSTSKYIVRDCQGRTAGLYGIGRDVTAQVQLEEERERREQSRQMFEGVIEADLSQNTMIRAESPSWVKSMSGTISRLFSETVQNFAERFIHPDYIPAFVKYFTIEHLISDYENGIEESSLTTFQRGDGQIYRWIEYCTRLYYSRVSGTLHMTAFLKDLDDEIKSQERLKRKAEIDALTGLLNRESTIGRISRFLLGDGGKGRHALLFIDLDCFKQINDTLGHPFGDQVLRSISAKLKNAFDSDDILGRVGGDEFMVLLKNIASDKEVEDRAEQLFRADPFSFIDGNNKIVVTCSIGVSLYSQGKTVDELYAESDAAMYRAKKSGKNMLVFY